MNYYRKNRAIGIKILSSIAIETYTQAQQTVKCSCKLMHVTLVHPQNNLMLSRDNILRCFLEPSQFRRSSPSFKVWTCVCVRARTRTFVFTDPQYMIQRSRMIELAAVSRYIFAYLTKYRT